MLWYHFHKLSLSRAENTQLCPGQGEVCNLSYGYGLIAAAGTVWLILIFLSLYPFYLHRYKKERYTGIWRWLGEKNQSPVRALGFPIGWAAGVAIVYSILELSGASKIIAIIVAVLAIGIYIGIAKHYFHRRR
jgi:hypothetical protein